MSQSEAEILAAEYVLGTLAAEARADFGHALERDPILQELVRNWEQRLSMLDCDIDPIEPPAAVWHRIHGILENIDATSESWTVRDTEGGWRDITDGVEKKTLVLDEAQRFEAYLLRLAPGSVLPAHGHKIAEECLVLEGDLKIGDLYLAAGDFHFAPAGVSHGPIVSPQGAILYIRGEVRA